MGTTLRPYKPPHLKQGKVAKWVPKTWLPMYEEMVALSCAGRSNKTIAEKFGYTEQWLGEICWSYCVSQWNQEWKKE